MPANVLRIQGGMLRTCLPSARSIAQTYSKQRPFSSLGPLRSPVDQQNRHTSRDRSATADAPSIQEKLPDPNRTNQRLSEFDLHDKVFVVTGGARGLGLTLAEALVEAGAKVYCLDRLPQPDQEFRDVQDRLGPKYGGELLYDRIDVREAESVDQVISKIADRHKRMDGAITAAAVQNVTPALEYPVDQIMDMMDINYKGVYCTAVSCARQMIKYNCSGSILLVASMSGLVANKGLTSSVYNSSKAAVCQLSRSLAMEWGKVVNGKPIRVNALCPGNIITPMVSKNFEDDPKLRETWERANMLGRISEPHEYRGAALFALSDASTFMTGSQLIIDGGYTAW
ncbi:alcohol dehydrogenase [Capronia coronata CBS 617.96]|uniref:Alcohol dehydrogenase n=1 Tax=Capronia coronata CBS 617.96 TaxID=1182541 RepID=W9YM03_9EURO|nr:alcohol dehydrogenase [Capronia coronata CBS 617.96]EXJ93588.1 alcohol dehydrogenase [Capronia coronata CBS 617.96]